MVCYKNQHLIETAYDKSFLSKDAKAAEAAASGTAYYDPNTRFAYVPPPYVITSLKHIKTICIHEFSSFAVQ